MEENNNNNNNANKVSGIKQITRIKEMLHRWQMASMKTTSSSPPPEDIVIAAPPPDDLRQVEEMRSRPRGIPPAIKKRLAEVVMMGCDSDEESGCASPEDVPRGYLAVYVGPEMRRFIIPTSYLAHSLFKVLLEKAEEEFGFDHRGGLTIPCEIETFKYLLKCIESHYHHHHNNINDNVDHVVRGDENMSSAGSSFLED